MKITNINKQIHKTVEKYPDLQACKNNRKHMLMMLLLHNVGYYHRGWDMINAISNNSRNR